MLEALRVFLHEQRYGLFQLRETGCILHPIQQRAIRDQGKPPIFTDLNRSAIPYWLQYLHDRQQTRRSDHPQNFRVYGNHNLPHYHRSAPRTRKLRQTYEREALEELDEKYQMCSSQTILNNYTAYLRNTILFRNGFRREPITTDTFLSMFNASKNLEN